MKLILFFVLLFPQLALAQWNESAEGELVIRGGWLFDSVSDERRPNTGVVIRDGKIIAVDADVEQQVLSTASVIDLEDTDTILPGMIDLHAHYNFDLVDNGRVEEVVYNGIVFLANGVTSTWSAGEYYPERVIEQRDRIVMPARLQISGAQKPGHDDEIRVHRDHAFVAFDGLVVLAEKVV